MAKLWKVKTKLTKFLAKGNQLVGPFYILQTLNANIVLIHTHTHMYACMRACMKVWIYLCMLMYVYTIFIQHVFSYKDYFELSYPGYLERGIWPTRRIKPGVGEVEFPGSSSSREAVIEYSGGVKGLKRSSWTRGAVIQPPIISCFNARTADKKKEGAKGQAGGFWRIDMIFWRGRI